MRWEAVWEGRVHSHLGWRPKRGGLHTRPLGLVVQLIFLWCITSANLVGVLYRPPGAGGEESREERELE